MNAGDAKAALRLVSSNPTPDPPPAGADRPAGPPPQLQSEPGKMQLPAGKWSRYAGKLGAALTVTSSAALIRKGGREPNEPDDADVDLLADALEEGLRIKFGDHDVPWYMGAVLAAGGVYAGMRVGASKISKDGKPAAAAQLDDAQADAAQAAPVQLDDNGAIVPDSIPATAPAPRPHVPPRVIVSPMRKTST